MSPLELDNKPVALFDIDGVLVRPWIMQYFAEHLANMNPPLFDPSILKKMYEQLAVYLQDENYEQFVLNWVKSYAQGVSGQRVRDIEAATETFWDTNWNLYVYNYTVDLIQLISQSCITIAISASPIEPVRSLCRRIGIEHVEALQVISQDGIFAGAVIENPNSKEAIVTKYIHVVDQSNRARSFGFGDTISDYPLWAKVELAFLFIDTDNTEQHQKGMKLFNELKPRLPYLELLQRPISSDLLQKKLRDQLNNK